MNGQPVLGAVITVGAWVIVLGSCIAGTLVGVIKDSQMRKAQMRRLRDLGDSEWEDDEVTMFRCGVDPTGFAPEQHLTETVDGGCDCDACLSGVECDELELQYLLPDATPGKW